MADTDRIAEIRARLEAVDDTGLDHAQRYMVRQAFDANVRDDLAFLLDEVHLRDVAIVLLRAQLAAQQSEVERLTAELEQARSPLYTGWGDA